MKYRNAIRQTTIKASRLFFLLSIILSYAICNAEILIDQLDSRPKFTPYMGSVSTLSQLDESELVSYFKLNTKALITKLVWSGWLEDFNAGGEDFVIRIYETVGNSPALEPSYELMTTAVIQSSGMISIFTAELQDDLSLPPGRYWIAFLYTGTNGNKFYLGIEKGAVFSIHGSGGAGRENDNQQWRPINNGVDFLDCRGFSMEIHGEYSIDETIEIENIAGGLSIAHPDLQLVVGGDDTDDTIMFPTKLTKDTDELVGSEIVYLSIPTNPAVLLLTLRCFTWEESIKMLGNNAIVEENDRWLIPVPVLSEVDSELIASEILTPSGNDSFILLNPWRPLRSITMEKIDYIKFQNTPFIRVPNY